MRQPKPKPSAVVSGGTEPGFTLHKLKHDDYHAVCGLVENLRTIMPDSECYADKVRLEMRKAGEWIITPDGETGKITGFAIDTDTMRPSPFARINGRLYHVSTLRRA